MPQLLLDFPALGAEDVEAALRAWLATRPSRVPQKLLERLRLRSWTTHRSFSFTLCSLVETREELTAHRPHTGQPPLAPDPVEDPGALQLPLSDTWQDGLYDFPFLSRGRVVECGRCTGLGRYACTRRDGDGTVTRRVGFGDDSRWETVDCGTCSGSGRNRCSVCVGAAALWAFPVVRVQRRVLSSAGCYDTTALPDAKLHEGEIGERIATPGGPGPELDALSPGLRQRVEENLSRQLEGLAGARVLGTSIDLRWVPVTEVEYRLQPLPSPHRSTEATGPEPSQVDAATGEKGVLWIYGADRKVHAPSLQAFPWMLLLLLFAGCAGLVLLTVILVASR